MAAWRGINTGNVAGACVQKNRRRSVALFPIFFPSLQPTTGTGSHRQPSTDMIRTAQHRLAQRATSINEAVTLAIAAEAKRMQAAGIPVISLSTGEPDFPTPQIIKEAAFDAINSNFTKYTQAEGIPELRKAVAEKFTAENGIPTEAQQVLISCGGKHCLFNALAAIVNQGDEVVIPSPYWTSYPEMVKLVGGTPVLVEAGYESGYRMTPDQLRQAITPRTRAMIINSPTNPTGVVYSRQEMEAFAEVIAKAGIYVLSDELYEKITYDGNQHVSIGSFPQLRNLALTINGVSKAFSMTGWRIGYMCGPSDVIAAAGKIQGQSASNPVSVSQKAALAALTIPEVADDVKKMGEAFLRRRDLIVELLQAIPGVRFHIPGGAFYIFLNVAQFYNEQIPDSAALAGYLLREHLVATVPGSGFGDDHAIRLSYACAEADIREAVKRIGEGLASLQR